MSPTKAVKTVADWKAMVYRHRGPGLGNGVRVLLLYLADHMQPNREVSVSRQRIASDLGVSTSEIRTRFHAAKAAGLLDHVQVGRPGVQAVYVGIFPNMGTTGYPSDGNPVVPKSTIQHGTGNPPTESREHGNHGVPAISKRPETLPFTLGSPRAHQEEAHQRTGERASESPRRPDLRRAPERSDAAERSEGVPSWVETVHDGWCLANCGTYLNTPEGQATGYCAQHRKDHAA